MERGPVCVMDTPCVQVCVMQEGYCIGCNRTIKEIETWQDLTDQERSSIMKELETRETPSWKK